MTDKSKLLPVIFEALGYTNKKARRHGEKRWFWAAYYEGRMVATAFVEDSEEAWIGLLEGRNSRLPDPFENLGTAWRLIPIMQRECDTFGLLFSDEAIGIWGNIASDSFEVFSKDTSPQAVAKAICLAFGEIVKTLDNGTEID